MLSQASNHTPFCKQAKNLTLYQNIVYQLPNGNLGKEKVNYLGLLTIIIYPQSKGIKNIL